MAVQPYVGIVNRFSIRMVVDQLRQSLLRVLPDLDENEVGRAHIAVDNVKTVIQKIISDRQPWTDMFDDGVAIVQWRFRDQGIMLLFAGDGKVTISSKAKNRRYVDSVMEAQISGETAARISEQLSSMFS
jgi:uncharacterized protein YllA (UPF0747 family)